MYILSIPLGFQSMEASAFGINGSLKVSVFILYSARPHGPLVCTRILPYRIRGESIQYKVDGSNKKCKEGRKPESYNIHVTPELSQSGCHMEPFYAFVPNKELLSVEIHEEEFRALIPVMSPQNKGKPSTEASGSERASPVKSGRGWHALMSRPAGTFDLVQEIPHSMEYFNLHLVQHLISDDVTDFTPGVFRQIQALHLSEVEMELTALAINPSYHSFDTTELKVPSLGAAIPHESLHVWPGCSYRVTIESNPHDGRSSASVVYTVPDCVEDVCSCAHARRLPRPHVRVSVSVADTINITWFLLDRDQHQEFNISAFIVGVGKEVMKSASQQSVYNTSWVRTVPVSSAATIYNLLHVMSGKGDFLASVKVKDSRNCLGPPGNHSFSISGEENYAVTGFTKNEVVWMTLLPSLSVVLALCIALGKVWRRGLHWCHNILYTDVTAQHSIGGLSSILPYESK
ncbi:hypothetical protein J6590_049374 [Homalodisca vitripennis]|nr:hypothetical protein J6590_049374 [Homalodisca vitripennis]